MNTSHLCSVYREYIACLNRRGLDILNDFVHEDVHYNGEKLGLKQYRAMLEGNFTDIPDLHFNVVQLIPKSRSV